MNSEEIGVNIRVAQICRLGGLNAWVWGSVCGSVLVLCSTNFVHGECVEHNNPKTAAGIDQVSPWNEMDRDPEMFFRQLVQRYQQISSYRDTAKVTEVTVRAGEEPRRIQTQISCAFSENSALEVRTPASQWWQGVHLPMTMNSIPHWREANEQYNLWRAPHMVIKFAEEPLHDFRVGVEDGFAASDVAQITLDDRVLIDLKLSSSQNQEEPEAIFDLFVNPESMLIERIEGWQVLSDGTEYHTTIAITPEPDAITVEKKPAPEPKNPVTPRNTAPHDSPHVPPQEFDRPPDSSSPPPSSPLNRVGWGSAD